MLITQVFEKQLAFCTIYFFAIFSLFRKGLGRIMGMAVVLLIKKVVTLRFQFQDYVAEIVGRFRPGYNFAELIQM